MKNIDNLKNESFLSFNEISKDIAYIEELKQKRFFELINKTGLIKPIVNFNQISLN